MTTESTSRSFAVTSAAWLVLALLAALIIVARLSVSVDLAYFLPAPATLEERVLMQRLGQGPGSQLIFVSLSSPHAEGAALSDAVRAELESSGLFARVSNGRADYNPDDIPGPVFRDRYLLQDVDVTVAGLHQALQARLADMALVADSQALRLFAADPYLAAVRVLERLAGPSIDSRRWVSDDGATAMLIAKTHAPGFDTGAQQQAVSVITAAVAKHGASAELHGVGVYGAELQRTIEAEATQRSLLASLAIALVLLAAYRSWRVLLIGGIPLALGALVGLASVALVFGTMHGITLAFGFTLLGVAIDYPLHVLSHARDDPSGQRVASIWPTLRLGAVSTGVAYLAIAGAGSVGLAQLGLFSAVGLLVAWVATRSLLPTIVRTYAALKVPPTITAPARNGYAHTPWLVALLAGAVLLLAQPASTWTNDLSTLTPVAPAKLARDRMLRQQLGAPDIRRLLIVRAGELERVLERTEELTTALAATQALSHVRAITALVPSRRSQQARRDRFRGIGDWQAQVRSAVAGTPLRDSAFQAFVDDAKRTATQTHFVTADDYAGSAVEDLVTASLYHDGENWVSVITLTGLRDADTLRDTLAADFADARLVDLKDASATLVQRYRSRALAVLALACVLVAGLLFWQLGAAQRTLWVLGTLGAALALTTGLTAAVLDTLSLFNLVAIVLVAGLGLDYCLFLSRPESDAAGYRDTRHAVLACAASTFAAFAVLAASDVPVLHSIGVTVATGVALGFVLARLGVLAAGR